MKTNSSEPSPHDYRYSAFGLTWQMPLVCPELRPAPAAALPDVVVRFGTLPPPPATAVAAGPLRQVTRSEARFGLPDVARLLIQGGNEITVERFPGADETMLRLLLIGTGAGLLLHQRGTLPLHASGIVTPQGAALFMGHSGAGKSTLVNAMMRRGYPMLCEDLAAVSLDDNGTAWVPPGVQATKLWADSAAQLGQTTDGLPRVRPELEKFIVPAGDALAGNAVPLSVIYVLSSHNKPEVEMEEQRDGRKFNSLLDHTWQKLVVKRMGLHADHFRRAVTIAERIRIVRVRRPEEGFRLDALADAIEADFKR